MLDSFYLSGLASVSRAQTSFNFQLQEFAFSLLDADLDILGYSIHAGVVSLMKLLRFLMILFYFLVPYFSHSY